MMTDKEKLEILNNAYESLKSLQRLDFDKLRWILTEYDYPTEYSVAFIEWLVKSAQVKLNTSCTQILGAIDNISIEE